MAWTIALAGKGGTGKTTIAGLLVRELARRGTKPILAVDSDPNANLNISLGMPVFKTVGQVQQEWMKSRDEIPLGVSKQEYLMTTLNAAISEGKDVDLLVMGRPQGQGCYCSANAVLRDFVARLQPNYQAVIVDNEAGMEHLSRHTVENIDVLLMVADPTPVGIITVRRLIELVKELKLEAPKIGLVLNRTNGNLNQNIEKTVEKLDVQVLGNIPRDPAVEEYSLAERSLMELPENSPAAVAAAKLIDAIRN